MLGFGNSIAIGLSLNLQDNFSAQANRAVKSMSTMDAAARRMASNTFASARTIGIAMAGVGVGMGKVLMDISKTGSEFSTIMTSVRALTTGEMGMGEMAKLGSLAKSLSSEFPKSAIEIAKSMEELVKAGLKSKEIPSVMRAILQAGTASGERVEGESGITMRLINMMMAWNMNANQAQQASDIITRASIKSTIGWNDIGESMKYSQDIMKSLGLTFTETIALVGVLGNAGLKGSMAGTSMGQAWAELSKAIGGSSNKKNKALSQLGLSQADFTMIKNGTKVLKGPIEIIDILRSRLDSLHDNVRKQNILDDIFGKRGKRGINPLIDFMEGKGDQKSMGSSLREFANDLEKNAAGSNAEIIAEKMKELSYQTELLKNNWQNLKITLAPVINTIISPVIKALNLLVRGLNYIAETKVGKVIFGILAAAAPLLIVMGGVLTTVGIMGPILMRGFSSLKTFGSAIKWAWMQALGANVLYNRSLNNTILKQQMLNSNKNWALNKAGSIYDIKSGRIIKTFPVGGAATGGVTGATGSGGIFQSLKTRLLPSLTRIGSAFSRLLGPVALVTGVMAALSMAGITVKNQIRAVFGTLLYIIGTLANALMSVIEIATLGIIDFGGDFSSRQKAIFNKAYGTNEWDDSTFNVNPNNNDQAWRDNNNIMRYITKDPSYNQAHPVVNVHVKGDAKNYIKVGINKDTEGRASGKFGLNQ